MPLRTVYISIGWTRGSLLFEHRKKKIVQDSSDIACSRMANDLRMETANRVAKSHFGMDPIILVKELYYLIYDSENPQDRSVLKSDNAPQGY